MKPVQFQIKMLTLFTILGLGPVQAAPQQDLLDHDTRRLGSEETISLQEAYARDGRLIDDYLSRTSPQNSKIVDAMEELV